MDQQLIIAIDFDKTIANTEHPRIHGLFNYAKEVINKWYEQGAYIIIWTCRTGKTELEAEKFLLDEGIHFHKINDHHPNGQLNFGTEETITHGITSRKVWSHILIDDTSIDWMLHGHPGWHSLDLDMQLIIGKYPERWTCSPDSNYNYLK